MSVLLQCCREVFRRGWWCFALAVVCWGVSGCKSCETRDESQPSGMSSTVRRARDSQNNGEKKEVINNPLMSEKANQISRDLQ